jgi:predicted metalloprotease with PDZ domain
MLYADLLARRAGAPVPDSTRRSHLAALIARYWGNAGNARVSPERASLAEYGAPAGSLGDYDPSPHLQGELLGTMLDLIVRNATAGRRSMDHVMRAMLERHSGERGFTGRDIERTVAAVCGCEVAPFFEAHVRRDAPIEFNRYLQLAGLRARVSWTPALTAEGRPAPDLRVWGSNPSGEPGLRLRITDPESAWGRAGLHTNDRLLSMNGAAVSTWPEMRAILGQLRIGDTVRVEVARPAGRALAMVVVTGHDRPDVTIEDLPGATERQMALRGRWMRGEP